MALTMHRMIAGHQSPIASPAASSFQSSIGSSVESGLRVGGTESGIGKMPALTRRSFNGPSTMNVTTVAAANTMAGHGYAAGVMHRQHSRVLIDSQVIGYPSRRSSISEPANSVMMMPSNRARRNQPRTGNRAGPAGSPYIRPLRDSCASIPGLRVPGCGSGTGRVPDNPRT